jgi:hypothetical protein
MFISSRFINPDDIGKMGRIHPRKIASAPLGKSKVKFLTQVYCFLKGKISVHLSGLELLAWEFIPRRDIGQHHTLTIELNLIRQGISSQTELITQCHCEWSEAE